LCNTLSGVDHLAQLIVSCTIESLSGVDHLAQLIVSCTIE